VNPACPLCQSRSKDDGLYAYGTHWYRCTKCRFTFPVIEDTPEARAMYGDLIDRQKIQKVKRAPRPEMTAEEKRAFAERMRKAREAKLTEVVA
jgi:transposase-like protein